MVYGPTIISYSYENPDYNIRRVLIEAQLFSLWFIYSNNYTYYSKPVLIVDGLMKDVFNPINATVLWIKSVNTVS